MPLSEQLKRLADFRPVDLPVISLYLNTQPDQHGRANFDSFVRKELESRAETYVLRSPQRNSFERDIQRINRYLSSELRSSANGLAIFACANAGAFFEAVQLDAPIHEHALYVSDQPHLYPLARLNDTYPKYAALLVDTNAARLFVFATGELKDSEELQNVKTNRTQVGGWSQARYQRHNANYHLHHAKEVVEVLDRVVREEGIEQLFLAGDEVIIPKLRAQLPTSLHDKVIDTLRLDITTPEHEVLRATLEALRAEDARGDEDRVRRLLNEYRAGGLAVVGLKDTLAALENGQADEVLISATLDGQGAVKESDGRAAVPPQAGLGEHVSATRTIEATDEPVTRALQTSSSVAFVQDPALLAPIGGVGAFLRFKL